MKVKCQICGNKIEKSEAYKVVVGNKSKVNKYYCSEEEYNTLCLKKDEKKKTKDDTYKIIYHIFGRRITNVNLFKELTELDKVYTYEIMLAYLKENEDYLSNVMQKDFSNEYAQIKYFTAILKNNLTDFKEEKKEETKIRQIDMDIPDYKFSRNKKRRGLYELEQEFLAYEH